MTPNEYQKEALRTASGMSKEYPRILNGLMGLNGEAGECIDILKKHLYQGHAFDSEHMAKELGDVAWYLAISAEAIGYEMEQGDDVWLCTYKLKEIGCDLEKWEKERGDQ